MDQYGCLFIDASWRDMLTAFWYTTQDSDRGNVMRELEELFGGSDKCLACFSVRSAFDLFLSVRQYPCGAEILVTAINIPDMVFIIEHHGLTVVPVDIDLDTLSPRYEDLKALVTSRTVAILTAHIYGRWTNMDAVVKIAKEHNLIVLEDCAESFSGFSHLGHPQSDLVFFSFGAIKYATAMGGSVVKVKSCEMLKKMQAKLMTYPIFSESNYMERLFRYSIVMFFINIPLMFNLIIKFLHLFTKNYQDIGIKLLRGFPGDVIPKIRHQPSTSMLRLMLRRFKQFDEKEHDQAKIKGDFVMEELFSHFLIPGLKVDNLNYWLFPILVDNPAEWVTELKKEKIEAYTGVTQLNLVKPMNPRQQCQFLVEQAALSDESNLASNISLATKGSSSPSFSRLKRCEHFGCINHDNTNLYPHRAKFLIEHILYLPVHKRVPLHFLQHLCKSVLKVAQQRHAGFENLKELLLNELKVVSKL